MHPRMKRALVGLVAASLAAVPAITGLATPAGASSGGPPVPHAVATSINAAEDAPDGGSVSVGDLCKNGNPDVNCNQYGAKEYVWLNGLPDAGGLNNGTYFFAVLVPGGQGSNATANPNDNTDKNLSDTTAAPWLLGDPNRDGSAVPSGDDYTNRTFTLTNGVITDTHGSTHDFADNKIRLFPYDDTTNLGGVYIMAVCRLDHVEFNPSFGSPGVNPSLCKYDAFKVRPADGTTPPASGLTPLKDADGTYDTTWAWGISKDVDKTRVEQIGGTATFNYTVNVTHDAGADSSVKVSGTITVFNPNLADVTGVNVTDTLSNSVVCTVTDGSNATVVSGSNTFAYSCELSAVPKSELDNTVSVSWPTQSLVPDGDLAGGSASFEFDNIAFTQTKIDDCVNVTDTFNGTLSTLGTVCQSDPSPTSFTYSHTVNVPKNDCVNYNNTATFTTNTSETTGSASQTVTVCGPAKTGALTMGYWQNKNGQGIISGGSSTLTVCNSGTWLRQYAPFQDLSSTAKCSAVATYVYNVIKAATCTSSSQTCNAMLKAQMLATALDVYFSDPALGANKINAPHPIGGVTIDLTKICKMIDGSGGTATCSGSYENVSGAFGGATSLTVSQMLTYAASQSNVGGSTWYAQIKATQVLAKDAFDAINNQVAFSA
jgi:hypothetical protein